MEAREALRSDVPRLGLKAPIAGGRTLQDIAAQVLDISRAGLAARARDREWAEKGAEWRRKMRGIEIMQGKRD